MIFFLRKINIFFYWAFFTFFAHAASLGQTANPNVLFKTPEAEVRVISNLDRYYDNSSIIIGIYFKLSPGWKTYWRDAGDAGTGLQIDWTGSNNLDHAEILWPYPTRFNLLGLTSFGYEDEVLFPILITPKTKNDINLKMHLNFLVCKNICIPYETNFSFFLAHGSEKISSENQRITTSLKKIPDTLKELSSSSFFIEKISLVDTKTNLMLEVLAYNQKGFTQPDLFIESTLPLSNQIDHSIFLDHGRRVLFQIPLILKKNIDVSKDIITKEFLDQQATITLVDGDQAIEQKEILKEISPETLAKNYTLSSSSSLIGIVLIALLGGLILNIMPCVLPVLSLKFLSLTYGTYEDTQKTRLYFLCTAGGIITSFIALGLFTIILKFLGQTLGWGIQFQQPLFLIFLLVLMIFFTLNLWGLFEISPPQWLVNKVPVFFKNTEQNQTMINSFTTGLLATLLATPCSAPFIGTAVSFALVRDMKQILFVFFIMGIGMALPYLGVALYPMCMKLLPKPGSWMIRFKQFLGLCLIGTSVWLIYLISIQIGYQKTIQILIYVSLFICLFLFIKKRLPKSIFMGIILILSVG
ncbi:MAG: hypothetical protein K1X44_08005, partial [Alphaproteobacteria bacterium]|nr:hypothetical protein [Alphaproteobacteria bacterium]